MRVIEGAKESRFVMCRLAKKDHRFHKYPPLPVLECRGYEIGPDTGRTGDERKRERKK
jgi:hypothetical protein